ncbi:MAG: OsmC family protein [Kiritimatiellae bacterium]|nr:OsmC family protein [Kiritimatiellia bacterium]MDW8458251.1 OsmC family protein [Verrucomicrobiota bacterium]
MSVEVMVEYEGNLRCRAFHGPSGTRIETDAPVDNFGKGERFSPTDLVATALASCIVTTIGILAQRKGWDVSGMRAKVVKEMSREGPRRIARLPVELWIPASLPPEARQQIEHAARACPVHKSIHPEIEAPVTIHWPPSAA